MYHYQKDHIQQLLRFRNQPVLRNQEHCAYVLKSRRQPRSDGIHGHQQKHILAKRRLRLPGCLMIQYQDETRQPLSKSKLGQIEFDLVGTRLDFEDNFARVEGVELNRNFSLRWLFLHRRRC